MTGSMHALRIQESVFPRTGASAAPTSDCAIGNEELAGTKVVAVNQEPPTLIGLTALTTNGRSLVAPKLNS